MGVLILTTLDNIFKHRKTSQKLGQYAMLIRSCSDGQSVNNC